ncbi:DrmB family protein [Acidobacteriota bacterium]
MSSSKKIGEIRRTQLVTTFGIGSIVDLLNYSVMIGGQEDWKNLENISEERLQNKLQIQDIKQPKPISDESHTAIPNVPGIRFPEWHMCSNCKRLAHIDAFGGYDRKRCICVRSRRQPLTPTRFVIACKKGHIDDFPWIWWTHRGSVCENPRLTINQTGRSTSISDIKVSCNNPDCSAFRSLSGIFYSTAFTKYKCTGRRPWLHDKEDCDEIPVALQRSSASVYFPVIESALSVPPFSKKIYIFLRKYKSVIDYIPKENLPRFIEDKLKEEGESFQVEMVLKALKEKEDFKNKDVIQDLRPDEYLALCNPVDDEPDSDFYSKSSDVPSLLKDYISKIILVHRLREVNVLKGFTRINSESSLIAPLSSVKENWLPGVEMNGEGIFIELRKEKLDEWKERGASALMKRVNLLEKRRRDIKASGKWTVMDNPVTSEFLLIHTIAHLLIQELTLESGYSSASLKERLYVSNPDEKDRAMHGFLIYTAASDSDGSLGGLVRQGLSNRFEQLFINTLHRSKWCSNDPLCIESSGQGLLSFNLSACHACALLPETSCELRNKNSFLDRGILFGSYEKKDIGYFNDLELS